MRDRHDYRQLEDSCRLTFRVCKAVYEDQDSYTVAYGIKGVDQVGNLRVHIREVSQSLLRVQRLVRRLNSSVFSQAHLMDLIGSYLDQEEQAPAAGERQFPEFGYLDEFSDRWQQIRLEKPDGFCYD